MQSSWVLRPRTLSPQIVLRDHLWIAMYILRTNVQVSDSRMVLRNLESGKKLMLGS